MARDPNAEHKEDPRVPPAKTTDKFLLSLLKQRGPIEDACADGRYSNRIMAALQSIAGGLDVLADNVRTEQALERPDA